MSIGIDRAASRLRWGYSFYVNPEGKLRFAWINREDLQREGVYSKLQSAFVKIIFLKDNDWKGILTSLLNFQREEQHYYDKNRHRFSMGGREDFLIFQTTLINFFSILNKTSIFKHPEKYSNEFYSIFSYITPRALSIHVCRSLSTKEFTYLAKNIIAHKKTHLNSSILSSLLEKLSQIQEEQHLVHELKLTILKKVKSQFLFVTPLEILHGYTKFCCSEHHATSLNDPNYLNSYLEVISIWYLGFRRLKVIERIPYFFDLFSIYKLLIPFDSNFDLFMIETQNVLLSNLKEEKYIPINNLITLCNLLERLYPYVRNEKLKSILKENIKNLSKWVINISQRRAHKLELFLSNFYEKYGEGDLIIRFQGTDFPVHKTKLRDISERLGGNDFFAYLDTFKDVSVIEFNESDNLSIEVIGIWLIALYEGRFDPTFVCNYTRELDTLYPNIPIATLQDAFSLRIPITLVMSRPDGAL